MGRCLRNGSVKVDHKKELRDAHEFFVKNKDRNNVVVNDNLNKFLNKFFKLPRDKKGTDLLFPEFSIFEIRDLIPYALKNWFTPIAEENLELTVRWYIDNLMWCKKIQKKFLKYKKQS